MNFILLINTAISAVKSVEALMPASTGADKLNAAMALVTGVIGEVSPLIPAVEGIIAVAVSTFHASGLFAKSTPAA